MTGARRYLGYADAFKQISERTADDKAFAVANGLVVLEGPWGEVPARRVIYIGVTESGERVPLCEISGLWRYAPIAVSLQTAEGRRSRTPTYVLPKDDGPILQRIELGRELPGMTVRRPHGKMPVQSDGLMDGKDFYFRSGDGSWSLSIGGENVIFAPEWYFEEPIEEAGYLSDTEVYPLLSKAAALYRAGQPTMAKKQAQGTTGKSLI